MKLKHRLAIAGSGVLLSLYGWGMLQRGYFAWRNHHSMTIYSPGAIAVGIFISLLALLPPTSIVNRWIQRSKT